MPGRVFESDRTLVQSQGFCVSISEFRAAPCGLLGATHIQHCARTYKQTKHTSGDVNLFPLHFYKVNRAKEMSRNSFPQLPQNNFSGNNRGNIHSDVLFPAFCNMGKVLPALPTQLGINWTSREVWKQRGLSLRAALVSRPAGARQSQGCIHVSSSSLLPFGDMLA